MEDKTPQTAEDDEINLLDYLVVLAKRKKLIISLTLGIPIITGIICLLLTPSYLGETRILPPQQSSSMASMLMSQAAGASVSSLGSLLGVKSPGDMYLGMVKSSRTIADKIIDRFDLMKLYDVDFREDARKKLLEDVMVAVLDPNSGIITIDIEDNDPKRAADMANAYVAELKNLNRGIAITEASQRRLFFEEKAKEAKETLTKAEEDMKQFAEKTGALQIDAQGQAIIQAIAAGKAQVAAKEVEISGLKTFATPNNPDLQKAEEALRAMKAEVRKLEAKGGGAGDDPFIPMGNLPAVGAEYARKMRNLKYNETLYELLSKQFEAARIDEARDATIIQVVDLAVPATKKYKPKTLMWVAIAGVGGFIIAVLTAFFMEWKERASQDPGTKERLDKFKAYAKFRKKTAV